MSEPLQWSMHYRRIGTEHKDGIIVVARDIDEAMSEGLKIAAELWPDEETFFADAAIVADQPGFILMQYEMPTDGKDSR